MVLVLLAAGCLTSLTGGGVTPVFPDVVEQLGVDPSWAGILVGMHTLTMAVGSPILGLLADRIGKVKVLFPSLVCYGIVGVGGAFANSFPGLLVLRASLGIASGGIAAASIGLMGGMYEGAARSQVMGYVASVLATASIVFPLLGGWLGSYHWRYAFGLYGLALPIAIAVVLILREPKGQGHSVLSLTPTQQLRHSLQQPATLLLLLALALCSGIFYTVVVYAPLYFRVSLDADAQLNGMILASRAVGAAIISALGASRLARRFGSNGAIALGFSLMAMTLVIIPDLKDPSLALLTALVFGAGFGIVMPNVYDALSQLSPPDQRSSLLAIGTGVSSLGQFLSPVILGPIWKGAGTTVFIIAAGVAIAMGVMVVYQGSRKRVP